MISPQTIKISLPWFLYLLLMSSFIVPTPMADNDHQRLEDAKIAYLLKRVEESGATFIRNGDEHPAKKAREHLEHKMKMARKMFWFFGPEKKISAREFIDKIASESSTTGEVYRLRTKEGKTLTTKEWLNGVLKEFHKTQKSP